MARKTRKMPSVDGWVKGQSLASVARERRLWTARREVDAAAEDEVEEADEGERAGLVRAGAW